MHVPPDIAERERIEKDLDRCLIVEASAGTGKTRSMVCRMIALLRSEKCRPETLCAVTFTRKAAAELRDRFRLMLNRAEREAKGHERELLAAAVQALDSCFIGTIHSFCARLIRERPVEAQVDPGFRELDDEEDTELQLEAWRSYVERCYAQSDPVLAELSDFGISLNQLRDAFLSFAKYPDVQNWPAESVELGDLTHVVSELTTYVDHMSTLAKDFPTGPLSDNLMHLYQSVPRLLRSKNLSLPRDLMSILEAFERNLKTTQSSWPQGKQVAKAEHKRFEAFRDEVAVPALTRWREHRYPTCLRVLCGAMQEYDRIRRVRSLANFQDLLLRAAALLRDKPHIRNYFRRRYTHILVDEFQDTDPIQAEVMMFLTADDPHEQDWQKCLPVAGSLFVVGDPKQSIYRFRRADITTYQQVKRIICQAGGDVVQLSANFRSGSQIVDWVNGVFRVHFDKHSDQHCKDASPPYTDMEARSSSPMEPAICALESTERGEARIATEAQRITDYVLSEVAQGRAAPGDFLIITPQKKNVTVYASALRRAGISNTVTGGAALATVPQLRVVSDLAWALAEPDNPLTTLAVLRGDAFGLSDAELYRHVRDGGKLEFRTAGKTDRVEAAFAKLRTYLSWATRYPPAVALELALDDCGIWAAAAADEDGSQRAGSLGKVLALLHREAANTWTLLDVAERVRRLVEGEEEQDTISAAESGEEPVRVMNLHQAKGLEAEQVFLAAPYGARAFDPDVHIDRTYPQPRGYLRIARSEGPVRRCIAQPAGWDGFAEKEKLFLEAERTRLRYVAATRAKKRLILSRYPLQDGGYAKDSLWSAIHETGEPLPPLPELDPFVPKPSPIRETVGLEEPARAKTEIAERLARAATPTYETGTAKQKVAGMEWLPPGGDETGMRWGTAIHRVLEFALAQPLTDLRAVIAEALEENQIDPSALAEAEETVRGALGSELIRRARASDRCYLELPFEYLQATEPLPRLVRGVIDLVFEEPDGWVIADYKTDTIPQAGVSELVEKYAPQIREYAAAWTRITGQNVKEGGLYFTRIGEYALVPI